MRCKGLNPYRGAVLTNDVREDLSVQLESAFRHLLVIGRMAWIEHYPQHLAIAIPRDGHQRVAFNHTKLDTIRPFAPCLMLENLKNCPLMFVSYRLLTI